MTIRREFLDWRKPALAAAAEVLRARWEQDGELDLGEVIVVVPGSRAGRRLLEVLVALADQRGLMLVPPEIVTPDQFPERLYQPQRQFAEPLVQHLAWVAALERLDRERLKILLPHPPDAGDTLQWLSIGESLGRLHLELAADGCDCQDVLAGAGQLEGFGEHERWQVLCELERAYLDTLDRLQLWDVQTARLVAIEKREIATTKTVVLVGMADLNRAQRKMLDQIAGQVVALVVAPKELADHFDEHGCLITAKWTEAALPLADAQIEQVDGPADQAEAVVRWMAGLDGRYAAEEIVVGLGEERLVPQIERQLAQREVATRFAEAKKVRETAPYRLLKVAADYAVRRRFKDLAALVRHPDVEEWVRARGQGTGGRGQGGDLLTALDRFASERFPAELDVGKLESDERAAEVLAMHRAIERLLEPLSGERQLLPKWADPLRSVLVEIYGGRVLDRDDPGERFLLLTLEHLRDALDLVADLPEELSPSVDARQACRIVLGLVGDAGLPPPADSEAVELMGWLELFLDDAPALVVTTFNEGHVPKTLSADAYLPNRLREALGLVHNDRRLARDAYLLRVLLAARTELKLIVARRDAEGNPLAPSRLFFMADEETVVRRARRMFGDGPPSAPRPNPLAAGLKQVGRSQLVVPRPQPLLMPLDKLSVTKFRDYIACPYRFYLRHVLALEAISDEAAELDGAAFGSLIHLVLEQFGRSAEAESLRSSTDVKQIGGFLDFQLDRVVSARYGVKHVRPAVRVQIEQARQRLQAFAGWQARRSAEGWQIVFGEDSEERKQLSAEFSVDGQPFTIQGRIDRIDYHQERRTLCILDYKTADAAEGPERTHLKQGEWVDLQLPLYRRLVQAAKLGGGAESYEAVELGYIVLPRDLAGMGLALAKWDELMLQAADERAREIVRSIRRQEFWPPHEPRGFTDDLAVICQERRLGAARLGEAGDAA